MIENFYIEIHFEKNKYKIQLIHLDSDCWIEEEIVNNAKDIPRIILRMKRMLRKELNNDPH